MAGSIPFACVGELACQREPFLREIFVRVVSCVPAAMKPNPAGYQKKKNLDGDANRFADPNQAYDVVFTDSVLFPEGGGQPCDHGVLIRKGGKEGDEVPLRNAQRCGNTCVISTHCPLEVGEQVLMRVDWERRLDHMQHHSAQHVLSAIVQNPAYCGLPTVSWSLTHPYCHIVLPTRNKINPSMLMRVEEACNQAIASAVSVRCDTYSSREVYEKMMRANQEAEDATQGRQSRPIPADVTGPIRIVTMADGIDSCVCCGTHVDNLAQLQMLKLLHQETKGDSLKLFFIAGERVRRYCGDAYLREKELMKELGGVRPDTFVSAVVRKGKEYVAMEKRLRNVTMELAKVEAEKLISEAKEARVKRDGTGNNSRSSITLVYRRDDVDTEFFLAMGETLRQDCPECTCIFAWASPTHTNNFHSAAAIPGQFMVVGPAECVEAVASLVCAALEGKGGMSKYGYRGKGNLAGWDELAKSLSCC